MTKIAVRTSKDASVRVAVSTNSGLTSPTYTSAQTTAERTAIFDVSSIAGTANTLYYYGAEIDGVLNTTTVGHFRTLGATSLKVCIAGDASSGSAATTFTAIKNEAPAFFLHLGDAHYDNIGAANSSLYHAAYDAILGSSTQAPLLREIPTEYVWDDHDYGPNDSYSGSPGRATAQAVFRKRVPTWTLAESAAIYRSKEVDVDGLKVIFIITDQRSAASNKTATDNSSKTILGTTQKTWFKNILSDAANAGKFFVWICPRTIGGVPTVGADHWGGFTTERTELWDHIKANCATRLLIVSADMHSLAIDDGTNHNFATGGGCPIPVFQAAPLDRTGAETHGGATYSEGQFLNNGQYGVLEFTKTGASQLTVDMTGKRSTGTVLVTHQLVVNL